MKPANAQATAVEDFSILHDVCCDALVPQDLFAVGSTCFGHCDGALELDGGKDPMTRQVEPDRLG